MDYLFVSDQDFLEKGANQECLKVGASFEVCTGAVVGEIERHLERLSHLVKRVFNLGQLLVEAEFFRIQIGFDALVKRLVLFVALCLSELQKCQLFLLLDRPYLAEDIFTAPLEGMLFLCEKVPYSLAELFSKTFWKLDFAKKVCHLIEDNVFVDVWLRARNSFAVLRLQTPQVFDDVFVGRGLLLSTPPASAFIAPSDSFYDRKESPLPRGTAEASIEQHLNLIEKPSI